MNCLVNFYESLKLLTADLIEALLEVGARDKQRLLGALVPVTTHIVAVDVDKTLGPVLGCKK